MTGAAEARPARRWLTGKTAQVDELLLAGTPHERAPALGALKVLIDESEDWLKAHVSDLASSASEKLGNRIAFAPTDVLANADYSKAGYGVLTESEREAIHLFAKHEGVLLDPVYTGRVAAGMIDLIRQKFFNKGETVLFLHTGGLPALFADNYANRI